MPARSVMNDVARDDWCEEICAEAEVALELLPAITWMPWETVAELSSATAAELGLRSGVPIAAGGGDDPSATLGAAAIVDGDLCEQ
jgi:xylulokinase